MSDNWNDLRNSLLTELASEYGPEILRWLKRRWLKRAARKAVKVVSSSEMTSNDKRELVVSALISRFPMFSESEIRLAVERAVQWYKKVSYDWQNDPL